MTATLRSLADDARAQWAASRLLRAGLWTIVGMLWLWGLLALGDVESAWRAQTRLVRDDVQRTRVLARERQWPQRADDVRQLLDNLRARLWPEAERGLAEAAVQDFVRATAAKTGLPLRDLALVRGPAPGTGAADGADAARQPLRLRVAAELDRAAMTGFFAELSRHERAVAVERMVMRPTTQPPLLEIELRAAWVPPAKETAK